MHVRLPGSFKNESVSLIFGVFFIILATPLIISPVSAEIGYTQKWMDTPAWLQERVAVSTFEPKLFKGAELNINLSQSTKNHINTGKDYLVAGSFNDAKTSFDTALGEDPESFDAWFGRAYSLEALKRYQSAVETYDSAIQFSKLNKNTYLAYAGKGRSSLENRKFQGAADAFEKGIEAYQSSSPQNLTELSHLQEGLADARKNLGQLTDVNNTEKKATDLIPLNTS